MVAVVAALMGAGLIASAVLDTPLPGRAVATGTGGMILGAAVIALALFYLYSPAWRTEVVVDDDRLEVVTRGDRGFRLAWTEVVRVVAAPARASAFVDGGDPRRSLLLPGAGARAPYRIADQRQLYDFIRAHVPADRVVEVQRLRPTEPTEPTEPTPPTPPPASPPAP